MHFLSSSRRVPFSCHPSLGDTESCHVARVGFLFSLEDQLTSLIRASSDGVTQIVAARSASEKITSRATVGSFQLGH